MPVLRNGRRTPDQWLRLADEEAPTPPEGALLVSLTRFRSERDALLARDAPLGVSLKSDARAHEIGADAAHLDLIEVELPVFRDGRAFSTARVLRERYGFRGTIRARGHILPDQAFFLTRCGVDEIVVENEARVPAFERAASEFSVVLQPAPAGARLVPHLRLRPPAYAYAQAAE
jgi:uncharacterized protein (DUF934 family)